MGCGAGITIVGRTLTVKAIVCPLPALATASSTVSASTATCFVTTHCIFVLRLRLETIIDRLGQCHSCIKIFLHCVTTAAMLQVRSVHKINPLRHRLSYHRYCVSFFHGIG